MIPFRGWVRKLTGAERYSRKVSAAIAAGAIRRAYLKGLGQAAGCEAPAAPPQARLSRPHLSPDRVPDPRPLPGCGADGPAW